MDAETQTRPTTPYERLGGSEPIVAITNRFYDLMDEDPAYAELRAMHAADLAPMRESLAGFLIGWSGGPRDWFDAKPNRCVMSAHKPLTISPQTSSQWMDAMRRALDDVIGGSDPEIAKVMGDVLQQMATGMISR